MTSKPMLYYYDPTDSSALRICIAACPTTTVVGCTTGTCDSCATPPYDTSALGLVGQTCPSDQYESANSLRINRCIPTDSTKLAAMYSQLSNIDTMQQVLADFESQGLILVYCCLIATGLALLVIILMRCCAGVIVWTLVLSGFFAFLGLTAYLWQQWKASSEQDQSLSSTSNNTKMFQALMIITLVFSVILLILIISLRARINLCITIFKEASKAMVRLPQMLINPLLTYVLIAGLCVYWIYVYLFLVTSGVATNDASTGLVTYEQSNQNYRKMWWYHLFGLFWGSQFILACGELVLASVVTTWYFTRDKSAISSPVTSSMYRLVRYHLGSVIFGALIIALVQMARFVLMRVQAMVQGRTSKLASFVLKCCACCLWCFENCLKFLNKNAYIEIAIHGSSFCTAARRAFQTLFENIARVAVINSIGNFVLFLCKLIVVGGAGIVALAWLQVSSRHCNVSLQFGMREFALFMSILVMMCPCGCTRSLIVTGLCC
jgi:solute carrier family 44 protein 1 (choline transporter-like protein)